MYIALLLWVKKLRPKLLAMDKNQVSGWAESTPSLWPLLSCLLDSAIVGMEENRDPE